MSSFFIDQHGCAKNQVDGELIISVLEKNGWQQTFEPSDADVIIVNSCGFIESAKAESIHAVLSARQLYPNAKILLAGCLAERYAENLSEELLEADGFFGNGAVDEIASVIGPLMKGARPVVVPEQRGVCCGERKMFLSFAGTAFVKITEGCNNRCSFCAIPVIRGGLRSRPAADIVAEMRNLVESGVYEINLIGQDVAAYGTGEADNCFGDGRTVLPAGSPGFISEPDGRRAEKSGLSRLIEMISEIEGTFAVRLLYIHPDHFNEDILPAMKADSRFLPYFDIPFQSGDDEVIRRMNRTGSRAQYESIIRKIRSVFPDCALRTTFMAGFPGESDSAAENTRSFLKAISVDWSGCFSYSREDDTPAFDFPWQVAESVARARAKKITALQSEITKNRLNSRCGKEYDVLIEEVLAANDENSDEGFAIGRAWFQAPEVDGSVVVRYDRSLPTAEAVRTGRLVRVNIVSSGDVDLTGDFVCDSPLNSGIRPNVMRYAQEL